MNPIEGSLKKRAISVALCPKTKHLHQTTGKNNSYFKTPWIDY